MSSSAFPPKDPGHWLYRLTMAEWLQAADHELALAMTGLQQRSLRPGVTHARRAAGMAWNAVLIAVPDAGAGRSYMDHVNALAADTRLPAEVREAARYLQGAPTVPAPLIQIGKPDLRAHAAAACIVSFARDTVSATLAGPLTTN